MFKKRKNNNLISTLIILVTFIILFFFSTGYSILSRPLSISGNATTLANESSKDVSFNVNTWFNGNLYYHQVLITIYNNKTLPFISWDVSMDIPKDTNITNYSGISTSILENRILCKNVSYNGNINPNQSTTFEFIFSTYTAVYEPTNIVFNGYFGSSPTPPDNSEEFPKENINISFNITNSWESNEYNYYQYDVIIKNTNNTLSSKYWQFDMIFSKHTNVSQYWNCDIKNAPSSNTFTLSSLEYNAIIPPNSSCIVGLIIETKTNNFIPTAVNIVVK